MFLVIMSYIVLSYAAAYIYFLHWLNNRKREEAFDDELIRPVIVILPFVAIPVAMCLKVLDNIYYKFLKDFMNKIIKFK